MAPFCQLPINLISCDGLTRGDIGGQVFMGVVIGLIGLGMGIWWRKNGEPPRSRIDYLLPASTLLYFVATIMDSAARLDILEPGAFAPLDKAAGVFSAFSLLSYLLLLLHNYLTPVLSTSPLKRLQPVILLLLPALALIGVILSFVSQSTVAYGIGNHNSLQAGFLTAGAVREYSTAIKAEVVIVLTLQAVAGTSLLYAVWRKSEGGGGENFTIYGVLGGALLCGLVRVAMVFLLPKFEFLILRRVVLLVEYVLYAVLILLRSKRIGEENHHKLESDNELETTELPLRRTSYRHSFPTSPTPEPQHSVTTGHAPRVSPFAHAQSQSLSATDRAKERAITRTNGEFLPLTVDLASVQVRSNWTSQPQPVAYQPSVSSSLLSSYRTSVATLGHSPSSLLQPHPPSTGRYSTYSSSSNLSTRPDSGPVVGAGYILFSGLGDVFPPNSSSSPDYQRSPSVFEREYPMSIHSDFRDSMTTSGGQVSQPPTLGHPRSIGTSRRFDVVETLGRGDEGDIGEEGMARRDTVASVTSTAGEPFKYDPFQYTQNPFASP